MLLPALAAGASFVLVGTLVGVRMLLLARRTRDLPEFLLGAGLTSLTLVTLPCVFLGLGLNVGSREVQLFLFAFGLVPVGGLALCFIGFTICVFQPPRLWARAAVITSALTEMAGIAGTVLTRLDAWDADRVVSAGWNILLIVPVVAGMAWTGTEALRYHRQLRKRLALGLADPVVCDRFRLWAIGNLGAVVAITILPLSLLAGWRVVHHPVPILAIAVAGLCLSTTWLFAFVPPAWYLRRVRSRAAG
ncbi:MAG: hypothetical protein ACQGVK_01935 [Myxococcota bacterium]